MINDNLNLNKVINLEKWVNLQELLATFTKLAMITIDYKGNPVTSHSGCRRFCKTVRANHELEKYCKRCDSRGGLEAVRLNSAYIYLCYFNIVDIAIPIIIDGKYIGAIMAGQVKLSDSNASDILEKIVVTPKNSIAKTVLEDLKEYYEELPVLSYEEVKQIANMFFSLCNYLVEEALDKSLILEMYQKNIKKEVKIASNTLTGYTIKNMEHAKKEISNALVNAYIKENPYSKDLEIIVSNTLNPAIEYIYKNKSENVTVEKMAKICHISPSYFSRLFLRETGGNFSNFSSRLKVEWAKNILEKKDMSINEISDELGFTETGYFIKVFKKYEGVTPAIYRKYCKRN